MTTTLNILINEEYKNELEPLYNNLSNYTSDVGVDLYMPEDIIIKPYETKLISLGLKIEYLDINSNTNLGYQMYPRSSIYKTKIRLANSVGIIDPEYRGEIKVVVDNISNKTEILKKHNRYFQLIFIKMDKPSNISIVDNLSKTNRGENGFGSTG